MRDLYSNFKVQKNNRQSFKNVKMSNSNNINNYRLFSVSVFPKRWRWPADLSSAWLATWTACPPAAWLLSRTGSAHPWTSSRLPPNHGHRWDLFYVRSNFFATCLKNVLYCSYAVVLDDKKIKICPLLLNRIQLMY